MPDFVHPINLKKPIVNRKLIAWGFVLTGLISLGSWVWGRNKVATVKEEGDSWWGSVKITYTLAPPTPVPAVQAVVNQLQSQIGTTSGEYGIYVYSLDRKVGYGISFDKVFPAVSIMKVPIMVATYQMVESGSLKIEDVQELIKAMGKTSDNDAPVTLVKMVGKDQIQQTVNKLGMAHTNFDANTTTAQDVVQMWKTLYQGKIIHEFYRQQMWEFLSDSFFEDRIPAGVPSGTKVVHKVGTDLDVWGDAGIVYGPKPFIVVILNKGVNQEEAKNLVPQLVKTIWNAETAIR